MRKTLKGFFALSVGVVVAGVVLLLLQELNSNAAPNTRQRMIETSFDFFIIPP
jgi:hypothetical protein